MPRLTTSSLETLLAASLTLATALPAAAGTNATAHEAIAPTAATGAAAPAADTEADLAKQLANPVASLISIPLQANWDFGIGVNDAYRFTLNVQPVVPLSLSDDWNLIIRTILPVIDAESPAPGIDDASGLGDTVQSFLFFPQATGQWLDPRCRSGGALADSHRHPARLGTMGRRPDDRGVETEWPVDLRPAGQPPLVVRG